MPRAGDAMICVTEIAEKILARLNFSACWWQKHFSGLYWNCRGEIDSAWMRAGAGGLLPAIQA